VQRKFIFNLGLLIFLNLLVKPFYILGIDTEVLVRVGQSEYGTYFALMNLSFLFNIFMDMGIVNFNTNNIAKNPQLVSKHLSRIVTVRFALSVVYIIICLAAAFLLAYSKEERGLLTLICINQILAGFILFFRSNLAGLQLFKKDSLVSITDRLILIVLCSVVLWTKAFDLEMSIEIFVYLQMLAYFLTSIIAFMFL